jgi:hypothetical protein
MAVLFASTSSRIPYIAGLFFALLLIVPGTALLWHQRSTIENGRNSHQFNWEVVQFYLVWFFAMLAVVLGRNFFCAVAGGIAVFLTLFNMGNVVSFAYINSCRAEDEYGTSTQFTRECTAGGILAYTGMILSLIISFSPFVVISRHTILEAFDYLLALCAFMLVLVGCIVLWTSDPASSTAPLALSNIRANEYTLLMDITVISIYATFFTLCAISAENIVLRSFGAFVTGYAFNMIFYHMWDIEQYSDKPQVLAGAILCWVGMIINMGIASIFFWSFGVEYPASITNTVPGATIVNTDPANPTQAVTAPPQGSYGAPQGAYGATYSGAPRTLASV